MEMEKKVKIPEKTKQSMWEFFLKTSIPRLVEKEREENERNKVVDKSKSS